MQVLDSSAVQTNYNALQFLRGALVYARQNWWVAFSLTCIVGSAVYELTMRVNAESLFAVSITSLALVVWFLYNSKFRHVERSELLQHELAVLVVLLCAPSILESLQKGIPHSVTIIWLLGFTALTPRLSRVKSSVVRIALLFLGFGGAIIAGLVAQIYLYGW